MKIHFLSEKRLVFFAGGAEGGNTPPPPVEGPKTQPETTPPAPQAANDAAQDMADALNAPRSFTDARWANTDVSTQGLVQKQVVMAIMKQVESGGLAAGGTVKVPVINGNKSEIVTYAVTVAKNGNVRNVLIAETARAEYKPVIQARGTVIAATRPPIAPMQKAPPAAANKPASAPPLKTASAPAKKEAPAANDFPEPGDPRIPPAGMP